MSWVAAAVGVGSLAYGIIKGSKAKKAQKKMEALANSQKPNASITDYYSKALERYNQDPYQSAMYKNAKQASNQNLATGINALQDRRSAVAGVSNLVAGQNEALRRAGVTAEGMKDQNLSRLGQAAGLKTGEDRYPFELKYNLLGMEAGGQSQAANAAFQSALNSAGSVGAQTQYNKMYSSNRTNAGSSTNYLNYGQGE